MPKHDVDIDQGIYGVADYDGDEETSTPGVAHETSSPLEELEKAVRKKPQGVKAHTRTTKTGKIVHVKQRGVLRQKEPAARRTSTGKPVELRVTRLPSGVSKEERQLWALFKKNKVSNEAEAFAALTDFLGEKDRGAFKIVMDEWEEKGFLSRSAPARFPKGTTTKEQKNIRRAELGHGETTGGDTAAKYHASQEKRKANAGPKIPEQVLSLTRQFGQTRNNREKNRLMHAARAEAEKYVDRKLSPKKLLEMSERYEAAQKEATEPHVKQALGSMGLAYYRASRSTEGNKTMKKSMTFGDLIKAHVANKVAVLAYTSKGKAIYSDGSKTDDFTLVDHEDAAEFHEEVASRLNRAMHGNGVYDNRAMGPVRRHLQKIAEHHSKIASGHRRATTKIYDRIYTKERVAREKADAEIGDMVAKGLAIAHSPSDEETASLIEKGLGATGLVPSAGNLRKSLPEPSEVQAPSATYIGGVPSSAWDLGLLRR